MLFENLFLTTIIYFLTIIQSVLGIGLLVLGTPILLIFNNEITEIMFILLPISFFTSLFNFLIHDFKNHSKNYIQERDTIKLYMLVCLPFMAIGLIFLKTASQIINFNFLVSLVILASVYIKNKKNILLNTSKINNYALSLIGFVHGLTNSGGSLMTLFVLKKNNNNKKLSIKKIHFFYMLLAGTQYLILISIFDEFVTYNIREILNLSTLVVISSIIGFKLNQFLKDNSYSKLIDLMAIFASIILILKIFFSA